MLHRYILGQILWPVLAALMSLSLLFLVVQLLKVSEVAVGAGLDLGDLLQVALLFLPGFAVLIVPISVLTGVLLGFGRMAQDGELVALAGAGVSPARLLCMPLVVGLGATLMSALLAGTYAPVASARLHQAFVDLGKRHVVASLRPGFFFEEIPKVVLYPRRAGEAENTFDGFLMYDGRKAGEQHILVAGKARISPLPDRNYLELIVSEGQVHHHDGREQIYSAGRFKKATIGIEIDRLVYDRTRFIPPFERMSAARLMEASRDPELPERERDLCVTTWHRRLAFPAASLLFALLGTVLAGSGRIRGRRRTLLAAVAVVTAYYMFMRLGDAAVTSGLLDPAMSAWLPDVAVAAVGLVWFARMGRVSR